MVEVVAGRLDSDVVSQQPDDGDGIAVVLLDVRLEVVGVGDRSETRCQHREGSDGHVIAVVFDLGASLILHRGHDLGSRPAILVRDQTLRVAVVRLVLGTSPILDIVAIVLLMLHNVMDDARGGAYSQS
jgi:hypothetical protein